MLKDQIGLTLARELLDALPHLVWSADAEGRVEYANGRWRELTGSDPPSGEGLVWAEALHPDDAARTLEAYRRGIAGGEPFELEARFRDAAGGFRWMLGRVRPTRGVEKGVVRWWGTWTDVDERKRLEASLREADRRKDRFLAVLGHELRNPLAAIRNALQITEMRHASPEQAADARRVIERQVAQLARLTGDLLDVNQILGGGIALQRAPMDVRDALRSAVEARRTAAAQRRQTLTVELPPEPVPALADRSRLEQVFVNLLNNAIKYGEPGSAIRVALAVEDASAVVSVRDEGIGIEPRDLERVFEPFVQLDPSRAHADGGLGIGLTLVRHVVELHGGRISASSEGPGRGSEFTVRLPALAPAAASAAAEARLYRARPRAAGQRILVVDDNADSAQSLATLLTILGNEVRTARDGLEALDVAERFRPDVVLLDLGMPNMDGHEAARRLRACPWAGDVLLLAMTGWSHDEDRARSLAAGFDHHLVKPVDPGVLDALLQAWRRERAAARRL